ncbi:hypothetical protein CYLTODRAFT_421624 [Cylindrobasidium torrendii FP15055 ss-10]|uniref:F-box domain-containing protein n=1 Tax=Cylindrobasidium torrendii FP15055 ss-10 TaxID=1314674 RepID=A0A0D7BD06_9AGAR|nr:hypothetical protein CYLTODRAFT_421624 [Cylindrobasidium torrendii FP15055 ss-10]
MPDIPLEIKLAIIDHLAGRFLDPFSGIALVWPEVIFRIREHRFSTIRLRTPENLRWLLGILEPMPPICALVRAVEVTTTFAALQLYEGPDLPRLFKLLTKLTNVTLYSVQPFSQPGTVATFHCLPNTITNVDLHIFPDYAHSPTEAVTKTFELLSAFPCMDYLRLHCTLEDDIAMGEDTITKIVAKPFPSLRTLRLECFLLESVSMRILIERGLFPNLESLTIVDTDWNRRSVRVFDGILRCWSDTLRELRMPLEGEAESNSGPLTFFLPPNLDILEFRIALTGRRSTRVYGHDLYSDIWIRTLEQRCRSGATLRSLVLTVEFWWPKVHKANAPGTTFIHRLDALIGSSKLHVMHLDWHLILRQGDGMDLESEDDDNFDDESSPKTVFEWVNKNVFPATSARFLTEAGRNTFGTTIELDQIYL